jgi:glycosyltransferase involved in cell wall biosynthesis
MLQRLADFRDVHMQQSIVAVSSSWNRPASDPLLSVIVPVFNTAVYLERCLGSLIPRDVADIEMIVVHDGGSDNSLDIASRWIADHGATVRATLIDQPNQGLSAARAAGIRKARGKFIGFLDSDDIADAEVLLAAARDAEIHNCDLVLFRSLILDGRTLETHPFYDSWLWDRLMEGRRFFRTTLAREPRLLRLEPNTNTRVIRRDFFIRAGIEFPLGMHYEDLPPHTHQLIAASAVGLSSEVGYLYRVNRPGKITDQRSRHRFDVLKTTGLALAFANRAAVSNDALANLGLQTMRLIFWCAGRTLNKDRLEFCAQAMALAGEISDESYRKAKYIYSIDDEERSVIDLFQTRDAAGLCRMASRSYCH